MPHTLHFLVLALAGWVTRHQEDRIDYLREGAVRPQQPDRPGECGLGASDRVGRSAGRARGRWTVLTPLYVKTLLQAAWMIS